MPPFWDAVRFPFAVESAVVTWQYHGRFAKHFVQKIHVECVMFDGLEGKFHAAPKSVAQTNEEECRCEAKRALPVGTRSCKVDGWEEKDVVEGL